MNSEDYPAFLADRLNEAVKVYSEVESEVPTEIVIHREGETWPKIELETMLNEIKLPFRVINIKKTGIPRIYDRAARADFMVRRGAYVQIDQNEALLVTSGPPHQILGTQKPLTIEIKHPQPDRQLLMKTCREVFNLSLVYGGYSLAVTSKPITTHFASAACNLTALHDIKENKALRRKAWFV